MVTILGCCYMITSVLICNGQQKSDTIFIRRANTGSYHAIFIDTNRNSQFYTQLENNIQSPFDSTFYFSNIEDIKENKVRFQKDSIKGIPLDWKPLYYYNHKYYVYVPSDGIYANWVKISDSSLLYYAGGEMLVQAINNFQKVEPDKFSFTSTDILGKLIKTNIYVLDKELGIAVFEYPDKSNGDKYELRVSSNKIRQFPIIVNYSTSEKTDELVFDKPNFKSLLSKQTEKGKRKL